MSSSSLLSSQVHPTIVQDTKKATTPTTTTTSAVKKTTRATCYCYFCSRHILITFVGMTLLIVSYGVNTVQMSAVPFRNVVSTINDSNSSTSDSDSNSSNENIMNGSYGNIKEMNRNANLLQIALPTTPKDCHDDDDGVNNYYVDNISSSHNSSSSSSSSNRKLDLVAKFENLRQSRFFGLFGSNFSLSYNLTLGTGNSAGNVTVVAAPAATPAYYYAPAAYYPYGYGGYGGYYDPYGAYYNPYAYNPYSYNPYAYDPYAGYSYYG